MRVMDDERLNDRAEAARTESRARRAVMRGVLDRVADTVSGLDAGGRRMPAMSPVAFHNGVTVDIRTMTVTRAGGARTTLTPTEWRLLARLLRAKGEVVDKRELAAELFGLATERVAEVEVYVSRLRDKLGGERESLVQTMRGRGYRLRLCGE